jgi:hypothetical protein
LSASKLRPNDPTRAQTRLGLAPVRLWRVENGVVVGRIFFLDAVGPQSRPSMWASGHNGDYRRAAHGYESTRGAAMAAFAKSWRRE